MKIDMQNFQPLKMFQQFSKGAVKIDNSSNDGKQGHIDKVNVATNIVNNKLNEALGIPSSSNATDADIFDFKTVSKNIVNFVSGAISNAKENGATDAELKEMLSDAKKGIKEGLADASKELQESGLLTKQVKHGIKETAHHINDALKTFSDDLFKQSDMSASGLTSYREASHYNLSKDASFSITTKEGDQINITFNSDYLQQNASVFKQSEQSIDFASSKQTSFQAAFSFEINGEINEEEQQAINELMGNLQNVSDLFFEGDLESAFDEAKMISMDTTHLAAFSMDLQRTETVASIKEYQQVMPGKAIAQQLMPLSDELEKVYSQAKPFAIEEHLTDLLSWMMPEESESQDLLDYSQAIFDQLKNMDSMDALTTS